ncbi:MAG: hypothetical protein OEY03_10035, partial [Rhizobacter sp.]|nr:hypothetical protein [Rhizobacter sp.]
VRSQAVAPEFPERALSELGRARAPVEVRAMAPPASLPLRADEPPALNFLPMSGDEPHGLNRFRAFTFECGYSTAECKWKAVENS